MKSAFDTVNIGSILLLHCQRNWIHSNTIDARDWFYVSANPGLFLFYRPHAKQRWHQIRHHFESNQCQQSQTKYQKRGGRATPVSPDARHHDAAVMKKRGAIR